MNTLPATPIDAPGAGAPAVAMTDLARSEIDIQISTAKKFPRSIEAFRQQALSMATLDRDIAASCFYKLKRKDKEGGSTFIEGASVRLAEIVASSWGNLRFGARIVDEDNRFVTAQGMAYDLEKNVSNVIEVTRRITDKNGRRYSDDMVAVTKNAACSIALRNAIFKTVPFTYVKYILTMAKRAAIGDAKTLVESRANMFTEFAKMRVSKEMILTYCGKPSVEDVGLTEIEDLLGVFNAIKDNETTIDEQFGGKENAPSAAPLPPAQELTARQRFEVAKAKLFAVKKAPGVEAVVASFNLTKDLGDYTDAEIDAFTQKFLEALK